LNHTNGITDVAQYRSSGTCLRGLSTDQIDDYCRGKEEVERSLVARGSIHANDRDERYKTHEHQRLNCLAVQQETDNAEDTNNPGRGEDTLITLCIGKESAPARCVGNAISDVSSVEGIKESKEGEEYSALVIDCGGGTTDLAACKYTINNGRVAYHLDVKTSFENGDENFGGNNLTYRIMQYLKIVLAAKYSGEGVITIDDLIEYDNDMIYKVIDEHGIEKIFEKIDEEYNKSEKIIPTKFAKFENKMSDEYRKIKNNFYMLWEAAEIMKKEFFNRDSRLRTKFDIPRTYEKRNDLHITQLKAWVMHITENGIFKTINEYPNQVFTIKEVEKIVKADIYAMLRKFLNTYYNEGLLFEYSLIKLSGQSTKINTFQEVLKEFVPGKMIEYKELSHRDDYELKLNCLDGSIKYLDYKRFGHMEVDIENEVPLVPYSVWVEKYNGEKERVLQTSRKASILMGFIDKAISAMELKIYLHNAEGELKKEMVYKNEIEYIEEDAEELIPKFNGVITQDDTDTIQNDTVRFFVYTDMSNWGFFVFPVQRSGDQLYLGKREYFPYEDNLNEISYFDGEH